MRVERRQLLQGQTSAYHMAGFLAHMFTKVHSLVHKPISVIDVGCGSGEVMMATRLLLPPEIISRAVGVDVNYAAVERLSTRKDIYDTVMCSPATSLLFSAKEFEVAVALECIEHLYEHQVLEGLAELTRVSNCVVISMPTPADVINKNWLEPEIKLAEEDPDPIDYDEFCILEGAVHKSIVHPDSMIEAGFQKYPAPIIGQYYYGMSHKIDLSKIRFVGIQPVPLPPEVTDIDNHDFRSAYVQLLRNSLQLDEQIVK